MNKKIIGITFDRFRGKWVAQVGNKFFRKRFNTRKEAIIARITAEREYNKILVEKEKLRLQNRIIKKCYICSVSGVDWRSKDFVNRVIFSKRHNGFFCTKHLHHMDRHGKILERTIYDRNDYVIDGDICRMNLYSRNGKKSGVTTFNKIHIPLILKHKWFLKHGRNTKYANTMLPKERKHIGLHLLILCKKEGFEIDHIDGNGLNNTDENLRYASRSENSCHLTFLKKNNTSGAIGIYRDKRSGNWVAFITVNKKRYYSGRVFKNKEDAISARIELEEKYHGVFANNINKNLYVS